MQRYSSALCLVVLGLLPMTVAGATVEPATSSEKTYRLDFDNAPWPRVLKWLGDKAGLPVITDERPSRTFNFRGPKEKRYTLPEVIDILNETLLAQGYVLVRRKDSFTLANTGERLDYASLPRITPADLTKRGGTEPVAVLLPLKTQAAAEVAREVKELLGPSGEIVAHSKEKQLLVHDSAAGVQRLCTILNISKQRPMPVPEPLVTKRFAIEFRDMPWTPTLALLGDYSDSDLVQVCEPPPGTFSLFAPRAGRETRTYTSDELLELVNEGLLSNRRLLIRRATTINLVSADQRVDAFMVPHVEPQDLEARRGTELVWTVLGLQKLRAAELAVELRKTMRPFGRAVVLSKENRLVLQDTAGNLRRICKLIGEREKGGKVEAAAGPVEKKFAVDRRVRTGNEVLEWLADQTGLPAVSPRPLANTFTFGLPRNGAEPKEYTTSEILVILNKALRDQQCMIVRRAACLVVVPMVGKNAPGIVDSEETVTATLAAITQDSRRRSTGWLVYSSGRLLRLRATPGFDCFKTLDASNRTLLRAWVLRINAREVYFQIDDMAYVISLGQTIQEALAKPLDSTEVKKLGLVLEPREPFQEPEPEAPPAPTVKLGKVPAVALAPRKPISEERAKHIKALIASLAKIGGPDCCLSATRSGRSFAPLAYRSGAFVLLLDDKIQQSAALRELVEIGPEALPFLLDALDDRTPTKHTVRYGGMFGGRMPLGNELHPNPVNPIETGVLSKRKSPRRDFPEASINHYTVKVGDVCFEALGQIMGRGYQAVRYQAVRHALRGDIVINSPTRDAKLCAEVRAIWASKDPARRLLDSLLTDYATEGVWNGHSLDDWDDGSNLQVESALRLLYYFPLETVPLIAARLRSFDVVVKKDDPGDDEWTRRQVRNGVRTDEFIEAVAWCRSREPVIQEALAEIAKRTNDPGIREALGRKTEEQTKP